MEQTKASKKRAFKLCESISQKTQREAIGLAARTRLLHGPRANAELRISARELAAAASFCADAADLGVKMTDLGKGPFGAGAVMKMSSVGHVYEVLVNAGQAVLGRVLNDGKRIRLAQAGANSAAGWNALLTALKANEGRA